MSTVAGHNAPATSDAAAAVTALGPSECGIFTNSTPPIRRDVNRFESCRAVGTAWHDQGPSGQDLGYQNVLLVEWFNTAPTSLTMRRGLAIYALPGGTGDYANGGLHLSAPLPCTGTLKQSDGTTCTTADSGNVVNQSFASGQTYSTSWSETIVLGSSTTSLLRYLLGSAEIVSLHGTSPVTSAVPVNSDYTILGNDEWRCDRVATTSNAGCVDPNFVPTAVFDATVTPLVGPVAHHMLSAQNTLAGNPGKPGSFTPLQRVSDAQRATNYSAVCGSSSSRFTPDPPTNTSCDEYPPASTSQGGNPNTASLAAVPPAANSSQGGVLNGQYGAWRIIVGDQFYIRVILADPQVGSVQPAYTLQNQFNSYSDNANCADWSGGDATNSVALPDGQRAWFFSDSYLGSPSQRKTFFFTSSVHNSIVVQNGSNMRTITGGNTCQEHNTNISFFDRYAKNIADSPGGFWWTGDQQLVGSNVVKFYYHGYATNNFFVNDYAAVASIPASSLESNSTLSVTPTKLACAAGGPPSLWGTMTLNWTAKDGYYYIYGTASTTPHKLYLARATAANIANFSAWQFFSASNGDGTATWTSACAQAQPLPIGNATGGSVSYINNTVWLVQDDYQSGSVTAGTIAGHPSDTPWGFTARHVNLYTPPEGHYDYPYWYLIYEPRLQQGLSNADGTSNVILTYNVNTAGVDSGCASASTYDAGAYRPRFVEVPTSWLNTYDAPQGLLPKTTAKANTSDASAAASGRTAMDGRTPLHNPTRDPGNAILTGAAKTAAATAPSAAATSGIAGITDWYQHYGSACPTIAAPNPLNVSAQRDGSATLTWSNEGTDIWYYVYKCDATAGSCATTSSCSSDTGGFNVLFGGLWLTVTGVGAPGVTSSSNQGHQFVYYVCSSGAQNPNPITTGGNGGATSHVSATVTVAAPSAPTNVTVSRSGTSFTVNWSQVTNPSSSVLYVPYYRDVTAGWTVAYGAQPVSGTTTATFSLPSAFDRYEIYVIANNIGGNSPPSNKVLS